MYVVIVVIFVDFGIDLDVVVGIGEFFVFVVVVFFGGVGLDIDDGVDVLYLFKFFLYG